MYIHYTHITHIVSILVTFLCAAFVRIRRLREYPRYLLGLGIHQRGVQSEGGEMDGVVLYNKTAYNRM